MLRQFFVGNWNDTRPTEKSHSITVEVCHYSKYFSTILYFIIKIHSTTKLHIISPGCCLEWVDFYKSSCMSCNIHVCIISYNLHEWVMNLYILYWRNNVSSDDTEFTNKVLSTLFLLALVTFMLMSYLSWHIEWCQLKSTLIMLVR